MISLRAARRTGIWDAIKASCLLCGARTLAGALVPLKNEGPELWDMENVPTPTILDGDGSAGAWDAATLTFSNENSSGNATRPRFTFPVSTTGGKSYYISGRFSGDYTDVYRVSLGTVDGATTFVDGVFSGTASDAASGNLSIFLNGTLGPSAVTIESLSIREVIAAPTNVADGFVEGDYTRGGATPGLKGDGTSYLDSGRANDDDPQNDFHAAAYITAIIDSYIAAAGPTSAIMTLAIGGARNRSATPTSFASTLSAPGLAGTSRASSATVDVIANGVKTSASNTTSAPGSENIDFFGYVYSGLVSQNTIAFYSIGEALDLEALDARVTALVTAIGAAV
jgi:hypothetical protein